MDQHVASVGKDVTCNRRGSVDRKCGLSSFRGLCGFRHKMADHQFACSRRKTSDPSLQLSISSARIQTPCGCHHKRVDLRIARRCTKNSFCLLPLPPEWVMWLQHVLWPWVSPRKLPMLIKHDGVSIRIFYDKTSRTG